MSSRPFLVPKKVVTNGDMSGNVFSGATIKNQIPGICYQATFTGTPTGTISVQGSNDYSENPDGSVRNAGTWSVIQGSQTISASGSAGNGMINVVVYSYAIRLVYTSTSGAGTLNAIVCGSVS